eukprot:EC836162.1.p1 GENE.EC836162.1~~EC836162.1.p1  ORF type:complete len:192 (+),score=16.00 EC836162.1:22-576(+)
MGDEFDGKIVTLGDGAVGKTSLLIRYRDGQFKDGYVPTIFDNFPLRRDIGGKSMNIMYWDTAGQEEYERLRALSYPGATCFVLCFSVDLRSSYTNVDTKWIPQLGQYRDKPIILVGTKADLRASRPDCITRAEGESMAKKIGAVAYMECSAKTGEGIDAIFTRAAMPHGAAPGAAGKGGCCTIL